MAKKVTKTFEDTTLRKKVLAELIAFALWERNKPLSSYFF